MHDGNCNKLPFRPTSSRLEAHAELGGSLDESRRMAVNKVNNILDQVLREFFLVDEAEHARVGSFLAYEGGDRSGYLGFGHGGEEKYRENYLM